MLLRLLFGPALAFLIQIIIIFFSSCYNSFKVLLILSDVPLAVINGPQPTLILCEKQQIYVEMERVLLFKEKHEPHCTLLHFL